MFNLAPADWLILLIYFFFVFSAGLSLKSVMTGTREYLQANRALPAWLCGLAFAATGLGLQAPAALAGLGAHYGFAGVPFALLGSIPAMLFAGLFMMPLYYGSKARTVPDYLALRFNGKTRALAACLFLVVALAGMALSLDAVAHVLAALHIFDEPLRSAGLQSNASFLVSMAIPAALVLAYVLLGGLAGTIYNQVIQLFVVAAGFLPVIFLGLKQIGGWSGLKAAAALATGSYAPAWKSGHAAAASFALAAGLGLVLGFSFWCADFRVVQTAMAAKGAASAQRAPLIAAAVWLALPLLLIVPAIVALGMPTPHTVVVVHNENGTIYHDITVVPPEQEAGQGLVPAVIDHATGKPLQQINGHNLLDYAQAAPNVLAHFLPMGLLGLGIAAILACMMAGLAAGVSACSAVLTGDLYQAYLRKNASEGHLLIVARSTAAGAVVAAFGVAAAGFHWNWHLEAAVAILAPCGAPLLAVILLGMFSKRITASGAFAGLMVGIATGLLPLLALTPVGAHPGPLSSWTAGLRSGNDLGLSFWIALAAAGASLLVAVILSSLTEPRPEEELTNLVHSLRARKPPNAVWWKRPKAQAVLILLAAIGIALIFI